MLVKKRSHIVLLVLFQLTVFVTPLFIKSTHIHTYEHSGKTLTEHGSTIAKTIPGCPIYKFEFVTSNLQDEIRYCLFQQTSTVNNIELNNQIFRLSFTSCLLRAPPVS